MNAELKREDRTAQKSAHVKTASQLEEERRWKQWMSYVQSKGEMDDLSVAEEEFQKGYQNPDGWVTDQVWSGQNIPEDIMREVEMAQELEKEKASFASPSPDYPPFILLPVPNELPISTDEFEEEGTFFLLDLTYLR
jgi:hypothetical protein